MQQGCYEIEINCDCWSTIMDVDESKEASLKKAGEFLEGYKTYILTEFKEEYAIIERKITFKVSYPTLIVDDSSELSIQHALEDWLDDGGYYCEWHSVEEMCCDDVEWDDEGWDILEAPFGCCIVVKW